MRCDRCSKPTSRLIIDKYGAICAACRGLSENGGPRVSGILTRNSERVRFQQQRHEGDMITPHTFDTVLGRIVPNPDFVQLYPDQLPTYFTQKELERAGYSQANKIYEKKTAMEAEVEKERQEVSFATKGADQKVTEVIQNI